MPSELNRFPHIARLTPAALTLFFAINSVSETLKFCELRGQRFETLQKNSSGVVRPSAHGRPPLEMSWKIPQP
ncbi:hypothetical protein SE91_22905 [Bradyrhizobium sp. DOA1]|nr:hypothetical protein SE91_22905 [Bradyrhizobium sp. DOA1]